MVSLTLGDEELLQVYDKTKSSATDKAIKVLKSALESDRAITISYNIDAELAGEFEKHGRNSTKPKSS